MQYSTPTPATRVASAVTTASAGRSGPERPMRDQGNAFGSMYPPLPAYETSLTAHRPSMPPAQSSGSNLQKPMPASSQVVGQQQSQNAPAQAKPAPQSQHAPKQEPKAPQQPQSKPRPQTYSVEVSRQALRTSRARSRFTTLRYNLLYAFVLYVVSSSRPYKILIQTTLKPEWLSVSGHVENALLALFFFNCCWAAYGLCTLPPAGPGKTSLNLPSPVKQRATAHNFTRSSPSSRPSTPFAASPISKPVVARFQSSPSANTSSPGQAQNYQSSPLRTSGGGPPGGTPTSKLRAALLGQSPGSPQGNTSTSSFGSPQRGFQGSPAGSLGLGQAPAHSPAREAFLSRHPPAESSPRRVMSERAALEALS